MIARALAFLLLLPLAVPAFAAENFEKYESWSAFERSLQSQEHSDYVDGISYILSGSIAVAAGFAGQGVSTDPLEKGVYSLFQSIGVVAIGYGVYSLTVGSEDHLMYSMLRDSADLTNGQRSEMLRIYARRKKDRERRERIVKAITHGIIAALNIYTATQQTKGPVQNALYFIGGVNVLAGVSYTFSF